MYKLVILIEPIDDPEEFDMNWPKFLHNAEKMPGLIRESTSRVEKHLFGEYQYTQIHELFFESQKDASRAMGSEAGRQAGRILQQITGGKICLFFADHKEDDLENIQRFRTDLDESI